MPTRRLPSTSHLPVLLVEQDQDERQRLHDFLTSQGLVVDYVESGDLAVGVARHGWPGVIIVGHLGEPLNPSRTVSAIRAHDRDVPIVLLHTCEHAPDDSHTHTLSPGLPEDDLIQLVARQAQAAERPRPARPRTVLLVDDDERLRDILQNFLELSGFAVTSASSGEESIERVVHEAPGAVLLDMRMPGIGGFAALQIIRARHPEVPVIVLTHMDEEQLRAQAEALGVNDYVLKPVSFEYLKAVLHARLGA